MEPAHRIAQERRDRLAHRLRMPAWVAYHREVAVAREPDVVELDLVEPRLRGGDRHVDVVLPDGPRVGVEPAEATVGAPKRSVAAMDRELRMGHRGDRILEADDAADQI